ncbi:MAG: ArsA family ATPase [Bdellovibrio sp.]|nr:ArsA family ATPase [Bdellovibrio sp.]
MGKTTLSAALGIRAALTGKNTIVITIDPAKRLATALGLDISVNAPTDLTPLLVKTIHPPVLGYGSFHALMPNTRQTFETFLLSLSNNAEFSKKLMQNPIFQIFTRDFSGANEYMALEKLYEIFISNKYDIIILDTPPSRNMLSFLNAPELLNRFFEEKLIRYLLLPSHKLFSSSMRKVLSLLEKLTGSAFTTHLFDFASSIFQIRAEFQTNLKNILELLRSEKTTFFLVTSPGAQNTLELEHFIQSLQQHRFSWDGIALNRSLSYLLVSGGPLGKSLEIIQMLQNKEKTMLLEIQKKLQPKSIMIVPELARDVHSLEDLYHVALALK